MGKYVIYNGKTTSCYKCSNPSMLQKGKRYEVEMPVIKHNRQEYKLKGVNGCFDKEWFDDEIKKDVYIAFTKQSPEIGKELFVIRVNNGNIEPVKTSEILKIEYLEGSIYRIETDNSVYFIEITY